MVRGVRQTRGGRRKAAPEAPRARPGDARQRPLRVRLEVDARRAQLLELGLSQFGSRAYDDVAIDEIASAAGISKGLLYHYFPTKRAFYVACVREAASRLLVRTETPDDAPPRERLTAGIDAYLDYVRAHGRAYATLMRSGIGVDKEIAAIVDRTRETFLERLTSGVAGALPLDSPAAQIALRGWVGFAEAASLAWVERCVRAAAGDGPPAPQAAEVRELLAANLLAVIQHVTLEDQRRR